MESEYSSEPDTPMMSTPPFPESFRTALKNKVDSRQLEDLRASSNRAPVFVYGSLMLPSVIGGVIGRGEDQVAQIMIPAKLHDYRRYCVKWADFPAILPTTCKCNEPTADGSKTGEPTVSTEGPSENSEDESAKSEDSVNGMLIFGLQTSERDDLDLFEGGLYSLEKVQVSLTLSDGTSTSVAAEVYVWGQERQELAAPKVKEWSIEGFLRSSFYSVLQR